MKCYSRLKVTQEPSGTQAPRWEGWPKTSGSGWAAEGLGLCRGKQESALEKGGLAGAEELLLTDSITPWEPALEEGVQQEESKVCVNVQEKQPAPEEIVVLS